MEERCPDTRAQPLGADLVFFVLCIAFAALRCELRSYCSAYDTHIVPSFPIIQRFQRHHHQGVLGRVLAWRSAVSGLIYCIVCTIPSCTHGSLRCGAISNPCSIAPNNQIHNTSYIPSTARREYHQPRDLRCAQGCRKQVNIILPPRAAHRSPRFPPRSASTDVILFPFPPESITPPSKVWPCQNHRFTVYETFSVHLNPQDATSALDVLSVELANGFKLEVWLARGLATPLSSKPHAVHQPRASSCSSTAVELLLAVSLDRFPAFDIVVSIS